MAKVKLNLFGLTLPDKMQFATKVITAITGNANFPAPEPKIDDLQKKVDDLQAAYTKANDLRQQSYSQTALQAQVEKELDAMLNVLGNYVENASKGDEAVIKSSGMDTRAKSAPVGIPAIPQNLSAAEAAKNGEIKLKWKPVKGSKSYIVRHSTDITDATKWIQEQVVTKASALSTGLNSGTQYWYQVAAVGTAGQGPWSDPATKIAG